MHALPWSRRIVSWSSQPRRRDNTRHLAHAIFQAWRVTHYNMVLGGVKVELKWHPATTTIAVQLMKDLPDALVVSQGFSPAAMQADFFCHTLQWLLPHHHHRHHRRHCRRHWTGEGDGKQIWLCATGRLDRAHYTMCEDKWSLPRIPRSHCHTAWCFLAVPPWSLR